MSDQNLAVDDAPCPTFDIGPLGLGFSHKNGIGLDLVTALTDTQVISQLDGTQTGWVHQSAGSPTFQDLSGAATNKCTDPKLSPQGGWPAALSVNHQVMHIMDIQRAYQGGLRLIFAAATDDELISKVWNQGFNLLGNAKPAHNPNEHFDFTSAQRQLDYIRALVAANSDWMQIVTTPQGARDAINSNPPKLAVVLSLEMDSLSLSDIQRFVGEGVAHVIPIHLADNSFGGTAIYNDVFNGLSNFLNGNFENPIADGMVNFHLGSPGATIQETTGQTAFRVTQGSDAASTYVPFIDIVAATSAVLGPAWAGVLPLLWWGWYPEGTFGYVPVLPDSGPTQVPGEINSRDLNQTQFLTLMKMGVMLDIAHMGEQSAATALSLAERYQYPLIDSHTGIRCDDPTGKSCVTSFGSPASPCDSDCAKVNERGLPVSHLKRLSALGGVMGMGLTPWASACNNPGGCPSADQVTRWVRDYSIAWEFMEHRGVALGSDANGFSPLLQQDPSVTIPNPLTVQTANGCPNNSCSVTQPYKVAMRTYSYPTDGIARYGLLPEFVQAVSQHTSLTDPRVASLFHSAEDTIEVWEKDIAAAQQIPVIEGIQCFLFDNGYANEIGPVRAIGVGGAPAFPRACEVNSDGKVDLTNCREWFGRCVTVSTGVPVNFRVFDDGYSNDGGVGNAIRITQHAACLPRDAQLSGTGNCRKWFGEGSVQDARPVTCSVRSVDGATDAIFFREITLPPQHGHPNHEVVACAPNGTTEGACAGRFGNCEAFPQGVPPAPAPNIISPPACAPPEDCTVVGCPKGKFCCSCASSPRCYDDTPTFRQLCSRQCKN